MLTFNQNITAAHLLVACIHCIDHGYADDAAKYARILARYYYRELVPHAYYGALRGVYSPQRPNVYSDTYWRSLSQDRRDKLNNAAIR